DFQFSDSSTAASQMPRDAMVFECPRRTGLVRGRLPQFHLLPWAAALALGVALASPSYSQQADPNFPITNGDVLATQLLGNTLYIGGNFTTVSMPAGSLVGLDATTGLRTKQLPRVDGVVNAIVPDGSGGIYFGGDFTTVNGVTRHHLAHV